MTDPDEVYLAEWEAERAEHALDDGTYADPSEDFWTARPELEHVLTVARAQRAGPWAVLGVTLARVIAQTPPRVVLPGPGSLNLFVGLVGRSGGGKGRATSAAGQAIYIVPCDFHAAGLGSGEGLAHLYVKRVKEAGQSFVHMHTTSILLDIAEVDTIAALGTRTSATIMPELRKGWSGERLGFSYADPDKRLPVHEHSYRLCLTAGIQPKRAGALLDDTDGGTPQRFIWLPVNDPYAPQSGPDMPDPWTWKVPDEGGRRGWLVNPSSDPDSREAEQVVIEVCEIARRQVDAFNLANLRGELLGDDLDTHAMFSKLKIGAALALLDGRLSIGEEDWQLAGVVKSQSDRQRDSVKRAITEAARARNLAQGRAEGERAAVVTEVVEAKAIGRIARNLLRQMREAKGWVAHSELRRKTAQRDRTLFDKAISDLIISGDATADETDGALRYRSL